MHFTFTDYKSYQAYLKNWRKKYRRLSSAIRCLRAGAAYTSKAGHYAGGAQSMAMCLSLTANNHMLELHAAKEESGRQRGIRLSGMSSNSRNFTETGSARVMNVRATA